MGKGDKKTKKGKRFKGSYGNSRKRKKKNIVAIGRKTARPQKAVKPKEAVEELETEIAVSVKTTSMKKAPPKKKTATKKAAPKKEATTKKAAPKKKAATKEAAPKKKAATKKTKQ